MFTAIRNDLQNFPNFATFLKTDNRINHAKAWRIFHKAGKVQLKTNQSALAALMDDFAWNLRLEAWLLEDVVRVKAWEVAWNAGVPQSLRKNIGFLGAVSDELNIGTIQVSDIETFIGINRIDNSFNRLTSNDLFVNVPEVSKVKALSVHRYTKSSFDLNGNFYGGTPNAQDLAWARILDKTIDELQSTRKFEGAVFRGQNLDISTVQSKYLNPYYAAQSNGTVAKVTETGYLSTSKNQDVAHHFINQSYDPDKMQVKFIINSKTGVDIDDISEYGKYLCGSNPNCNLIQEEVLIKKGLDFEIFNVTDEVINGISVKVITLKEL